MKDSYTFLPLEKQKDKLIEICLKTPNLKRIFNNLDFPNDFPWYIGAGCVNQTVWNHITDKDITYGIGDYDIAYWDDNISKEAELATQKTVMEQFTDPSVELEVINEARVHLWFEEDFGKKIEPFINVEHAISTWPTTATCVGITRVNKEYSVVAPYGLNDLFSMKLRPNFPSVLPDVFKAKTKKWKSKWSELEVVGAV